MSTQQSIRGITVPPANGAKPTALVVLLHGYGGNGRDLLRALQALQQQFPTLAFAAPDGPFHLQGASHAWVPLRMPFSWDQLETGLPAVAPSVRAYIEAELHALGLSHQHLILVGFSQGALLGLELGLTGTEAPKAVIMLAGFFATKASTHAPQATPPVYLLAGEDDTVMNPHLAAATAEALAAAHVRVQTFRFPGLGHQIDDRVVATVATILQDELNRK